MNDRLAEAEKRADEERAKTCRDVAEWGLRITRQPGSYLHIPLYTHPDASTWITQGDAIGRTTDPAVLRDLAITYWAAVVAQSHIDDHHELVRVSDIDCKQCEIHLADPMREARMCDEMHLNKEVVTRAWQSGARPSEMWREELRTEGTLRAEIAELQAKLAVRERQLADMDAGVIA
jgi:hypothetical protein